MVSIPKDIPTLDNALYSGKGFTASVNLVLPELTQSPRIFMNGDILSICNKKLGNITQQFMYGKSKGWVLIK